MSRSAPSAAWTCEWLNAGAILHVRAGGPSMLSRQEPVPPTTTASIRVHQESTAAAHGAEHQMHSPFQGQQPSEDHAVHPCIAQNNGRLFPDTPEGHMATVCMSMNGGQVGRCFVAMVWSKSSIN